MRMPSFYIYGVEKTIKERYNKGKTLFDYAIHDKSKEEKEND